MGVVIGQLEEILGRIVPIILGRSVERYGDGPNWCPKHSKIATVGQGEYNRGSQLVYIPM